MIESEATGILALLSGAFPQRPIETATKETYRIFLADLPFQATLQAVKGLIANSESEWFPQIADIRRAVIAERERLPAPEAAWGEVQRAISRWGRYKEPKFTHPAIAKAVECIGWQQICNSTEPDVIRGQFIKSFYGPLSKRWQDDANVTSLLGPSDRRQLGTQTAGDLMKRLGGGK